MKKIVSAILALTLVSAASVTASALTVSPLEDKDIDVNAKYVDGASTPEVYSVDIEWGEMQFTYTESGTNVWNAATHQYTLNSDASWSESGNDVTVTNHSNDTVDVEFTYASLNEFAGVTGSFDVESDTLDAGAVDGYDTADSVTTKLTLDGTIDSSETEFVKVGAITVKLS